jgi:hypothetical protein
MHRLLGIDDFLIAASEATGIPEQELDTEPVLTAAKRALDRAGAQKRGGGKPVAVYPDLTSKASAMVSSLLREPPLKDNAGGVAYACLRALLARNDARWIASAPMTILRFEEESRQPTGSGELAAFLGEHIECERRKRSRRRNPTQSALFVYADLPPLRVGVMLSNPFHTLTPDERAALGKIEPAIREGLRLAEQRLKGALKLQLHHPSTSVPKKRPRISAPDLWAWISQLLRDEIDALIICEVGSKCADFGSAIELEQHALQDGPLVYLHKRDCGPRSRYIDGRKHELALQVIDYDDLQKLSKDLSRWVVQHSQEIEVSTRRRRDRRRMYRSLRKRLVVAWDRAQPQEREFAADAAGLSIEEVQRVLTNALTVATLPAHRLDTICRMLGVSRDERRVARGSPRRVGLINYAALLQAGVEQRWNAGTMFALHDRAVATQARVVGHRARLRLTSPADWIRFRDAHGI